MWKRDKRETDPPHEVRMYIRYTQPKHRAPKGGRPHPRGGHDQQWELCGGELDTPCGMYQAFLVPGIDGVPTGVGLHCTARLTWTELEADLVTV